MPATPGPALASWTPGRFSADGYDFPTYAKGEGPGVVVIHELPGLTPHVVAFAEELVAAGYRVVLPHLFGEAAGSEGAGSEGAAASAQAFAGVCVRAEFTKLATGVTAPLAGWLRALAADLAASTGGGVGALGMCFTGGFALAMMLEESVLAPVLAQPAVPFAVGKARAADVNLSPSDFAAMAARATGGCPVLGLRFAGDRAVGTRFATLERALGDSFRHVDLPGSGHSTLTLHRSQVAVDAVLDFFAERLPSARPPNP